MTQTTEDTSRSPTMAELLRLAIDSAVRDVWTALPGRVEKYDPAKQMADVKPLVQDLVATEDGEEFAEELPVIPNVPVRFPRAGGFYITVPVEKGDYCLLVFCSRSIDKYLEGSGNDTNPEDFRTHDLADAVALMGVGPFSVAISDYQEKRIVIGKEGGTQVHVADDLIELGAKDAAEQAVINSKLQTELSRLKSELDGFKTTFDSHIHVLTPAVATVAPPAAGFPAPASPGATESELVTIEK